jgi:hypothetical protein
MNKQDQFKAIRRTYRIARKTSPLSHDNAVTLYMATVSAMRTFTGKWDCCEPINWAFTAVYGLCLWAGQSNVGTMAGF